MRYDVRNFSNLNHLDWEKKYNPGESDCIWVVKSDRLLLSETLFDFVIVSVSGVPGDQFA